ncbi:LLM class flavin-dependent oxidoreductase, partial [Myxococcota bacterium]|nr:LLM class flavin-dependent oxidoreductase [Myxococcota bacterium]
MISFGSLVINDSLERGKGLESFQARIRRLEALGFDSIAMPDSQSLWPEMYIQLSVAALATERVALWPAVTNPLTRHPAVAASAIATVEQLAPGRGWFN